MFLYGKNSDKQSKETMIIPVVLPSSLVMAALYTCVCVPSNTWPCSCVMIIFHWGHTT